MEKHRHWIDERYSLAKEKDSEKTPGWTFLLSYPCLLLRWQQETRDVKRIAVISSHRLDHHVWCKSPEQCNRVHDWLRITLIRNLVLTLAAVNEINPNLQLL